MNRRSVETSCTWTMSRRPDGSADHAIAGADLSCLGAGGRPRRETLQTMPRATNKTVRPSGEQDDRIHRTLAGRDGADQAAGGGLGKRDRLVRLGADHERDLARSARRHGRGGLLGGVQQRRRLLSFLHRHQPHLRGRANGKDRTAIGKHRHGGQVRDLRKARESFDRGAVRREPDHVHRPIHHVGVEDCRPGRHPETRRGWSWSGAASPRRAPLTESGRCSESAPECADANDRRAVRGHREVLPPSASNSLRVQPPGRSRARDRCSVEAGRGRPARAARPRPPPPCRPAAPAPAPE